MKIGPISSLVVQGTSLCNLNCSYCYISEEDRKDANYLSLENFEVILRKVLKFKSISKHIQVLWHAGEPLVMPVDYYEEAIKITEKVKQSLGLSDVKIRHYFQSNGILVNDKWCEFFKRHDVVLGISCDGYTHDKYRLDWRSQGTLSRVLDSIKTLNLNEVKYGVLCTVTPEAIENPERFLEFFNALGIVNLGLNPVEEIGAFSENLFNSKDYHIKYHAFLSSLMAMVRENRSSISIREFSTIYEAIFDKSRPSHMHFDIELEPFRILTIDAKGNFSTFSPELLTSKTEYFEDGNFILGNLLDEDLEDVISKPKFIKLYNSIQKGKINCQKECEYFDLCGGGFPSTKYFEHGTFECTETSDCILRRQIPAQIALESLENYLITGQP
jgi:uncharacterized protein